MFFLLVCIVCKLWLCKDFFNRKCTVLFNLQVFSRHLFFPLCAFDGSHFQCEIIHTTYNASVFYA